LTLLVASLFAESFEQIAAASRRAFDDGADAVELRIDSFEGDPPAIASLVRAQPARTWIVTCRSAEEGGQFRGDTMERVSRLLAAARGTNAYVDFEFADWQRSANIRQKVLLAAAASDGSHRLILSHHDFRQKPIDLDSRVAAMLAVPEAAVVKIVYRGRTAADSFAALDLMYTHMSRIIAIDMGESGLSTRVLAKKFGAFATFASLDADAKTAPGQTTVREMRIRFGWDRIRASTRVFGVIGDPVTHSMSPTLFNYWFQQGGEDAVYVPIRIGREPGEPERFLEGVRTRTHLGVRGLSVTLPHKSVVRGWLGGGADWLAQRIGAVNTVSVRGGEVSGFNTDCYAAVSSLAGALGGATTDLGGVSVDVLGAGGAAQAVVAGLADLGCRVCVFARRPDATAFGGAGFEVRGWDERVDARADILINCTPIGMRPRVEESPMPAESLRGRRLVFDLIYNPLETRLLREARSAGCLTLNGLDMFLRQAATQFELWVGRSPDQETAMARLSAELDREGSGPFPHSTWADHAEERAARCIVLIGLRGSGKTTVGQELAKLHDGHWLDTDEEVERRTGKSIAEIFSIEGEGGFRRIEAEVIAGAGRIYPRVLSLGGGAVLDESNVAALRPFATFVWLTAAPETLWERIAGDPTTAARRPGLTKQGGLSEIQELLARREPIYRRIADLVVDTAGRTPREVAREILEKT